MKETNKETENKKPRQTERNKRKIKKQRNKEMN